MEYMQTVPRLIHSFTPAAYELSLTIQREARKFHGIITIQGLSHQAGTMSLHAKDLTIISASVNGSSVSWEAGDNDELRLIGAGIPSGSITAVISYSGIITDQMHGIYPCYFEHEGTKKELIATQFESHHAREAFPCVDEPEAKATFDVTLTTEQSVTVLANMPIEFQQNEHDVLVTRFARTPRMSSYLLAWVIGELHSTSATTASGVEVNIWATPAQAPATLSFALNIATRTIDFFDDFFGIPYPLPKSDHVALPDFSSGAMENWGLITYREIALLADPNVSSVSSKHYIATVIAHELSHQWFGNLVTMKWWNDLWLNESFATLMEYIAIDALEPSWNVWLDFAANESVMALRRDAVDGVQSVQVEVQHPDEISSLFDGAIVYAKGARLMRMLQVYVGNDAFQKGLSEYFAEFAYKNTEADDLWTKLSDASGKDIKSLMNAWISQPGYPVVTMNDGVISQTQFFIGEHTDATRVWPVPLEASNDAVPALLDAPSLRVDVDLSTTLLNITDSAHFITEYSELHMEAILAQLDKLSVVQRLQILHERTLLARAGRISSASLLPLISAYRFESIESVWDIIGLTIGELKKFVEKSQPAEAALRSLAGTIAELQFERLGWDESSDETETDTKLRSTILGLMLYSERETLLQEASNRYSIDSVTSLAPETRSLILSSAVRYGEPSVVDDMLALYCKTTSSDLQQDLAVAMTATQDTTVAQRLLDACKDPQIIRQQDTFRWFAYLARNRYTRDIAWLWLKNNWVWVKRTYGGDKSYDDFVRYGAAAITSRTQLNEFTAFFEPMQSEPALQRTIALAISEITARITLLERDTQAVVAALVDQ